MDVIRAFGYARKSADDKEETEISITNQVELIKKTCKEKGWELVDIFIDRQVSGSDRERKEYVKMRQQLYGSDVSVLVVKEQDRFARDSSFFRDELIDYNARGKRVYTCIRNKFLSHEDLGDSVTSIMDDHYIVTQRKKTNSLFEQKAEEGLPVIKAPFGYKNDTDKHSFVIVKKDAKIVLGVIQDYLNKRDYRATMKDFKINKSKYYRIIKTAKNGVYSGFVYYEKKIKDSNKKIVRIEPVSYKGTHQAIISEELWEKFNEDS